MRSLIILSCSLAAASTLVAGPSANGKTPVPPVVIPPDKSPWQIGGGWQYRSLGDFRFETRTRSAAFILPTLLSAQGRKSYRSGDDLSEADRTYDDGYVFQDIGTSVDGLTAYWGYNENSQLDLGTNQNEDSTLTLHDSSLSSSFGSFRNGQPTTTWDAEADGWGPFVQLSYVLPLRGAWAVKFDGVFSYLPFESSRSFSNLSAGQNSSFRTQSRADTFDIASNADTIPLGGYSGQYDSVSPIVYNVPINRVNGGGRAGSNFLEFSNIGRSSFDLKNYTLSLGSNVTWSRGPVTLALGLGAALNIASWDASQSEIVFISRDGGRNRVLKKWSDHSSGTDLLPGFYLQSGLEVALGRGFALTAFGRYDWGQNLTGSVGPSSFSLEMDGWTAGAGLTVQF
jgi:hypothetical protein